MKRNILKHLELVVMSYIKKMACWYFDLIKLINKQSTCVFLSFSDKIKYDKGPIALELKI